MDFFKEQERLQSMYRLERDLLQIGYKNIAGIDEAGRGPLAGPVVASCVILGNNFIEGLNDSKLLSPKKRKALFEILKRRAVYSVAIVDVSIIDEINILQATLLAMKEAVLKIKEKIDFILVDGIDVPKINLPMKAVVQGDKKSLCIAAASIIAKETRDSLMEKYHERWPEYDFKKNKGYGTKKHREMIEKYGPCEIHRKSFEPVKSMV